MAIPTAGIYPGVTRAEYDTIPAVNHSTLKRLKRSPLHCRAGAEPETDATKFGTLVHAYILEGERFARSHVLIPDLTLGIKTKAGSAAANPRATTEYRARAKAFGERNIGKTFVEPEQWAALERIGEAIAGHETAARLLNAPHSAEVLVVWLDEPSGLWCKALVDHLGPERIVDLKTAADASPGAFAAAAAKYSYHTQAAFYLAGLAAVLGEPLEGFVHIAVEGDPPHGVAAYELDGYALAAGLDTVRDWLEQYADCERSGHWPGYPDSVQPLSLPRYAYQREKFQ